MDNDGRIGRCICRKPLKMFTKSKFWIELTGNVWTEVVELSNRSGKMHHSKVALRSLQWSFGSVPVNNINKFKIHKITLWVTTTMPGSEVHLIFKNIWNNFFQTHIWWVRYGTSTRKRKKAICMCLNFSNIFWMKYDKPWNGGMDEHEPTKNHVKFAGNGKPKEEHSDCVFAAFFWEKSEKKKNKIL